MKNCMPVVSSPHARAASGVVAALTNTQKGTEVETAECLQRVESAPSAECPERVESGHGAGNETFPRAAPHGPRTARAALHNPSVDRMDWGSRTCARISIWEPGVAE